MVNLNQDLADLTTIPKLQIDNLNKIQNSLICHYVAEAKQNGEDLIVIDIGLGTVSIKLEQEEIKYKFTPSHKLEVGVKHTVTHGESPLVVDAETVIRDRICNAYKDLFGGGV